MLPQKPPKWAIGLGVALLVLGLGSLLYSNGWSQGFISGLLVNSSDGANLAPYYALRGGPGWGHGGFGFFRFLFFLLFLGLIFKAIGCWRWRHEHGPWGGHPQQSQPQQPQSPEQPSAQANPSSGGASQGDDAARPVSWQPPVIDV